MDTEKKLANMHTMNVPHKVELLDMSDTTHQKVRYIPLPSTTHKTMLTGLTDNDVTLHEIPTVTFDIKPIIRFLQGDIYGIVSLLSVVGVALSGVQKSNFLPLDCASCPWKKGLAVGLVKAFL